MKGWIRSTKFYFITTLYSIWLNGLNAVDVECKNYICLTLCWRPNPSPAVTLISVSIWHKGCNSKIVYILFVQRYYKSMLKLYAFSGSPFIYILMSSHVIYYYDYYPVKPCIMKDFIKGIFVQILYELGSFWWISFLGWVNFLNVNTGFLIFW